LNVICVYRLLNKDWFNFASVNGAIGISLLNNPGELDVLSLQLEHLLLQLLLLYQTFLLVCTHLGIWEQCSLLLHLVHAVGSVQSFVSIWTKFRQLNLYLIKLFIQIIKWLLALGILLAHILELFASVRHNDDCYSDLPSKLRKFLVTFFDFLIERLILNLKLLKVNQMETVRKLLLLFEDFLTVSQLIP